MGYGAQAPSADVHLREKIELALAERLSELAGASGNPQADLVTAVGQNPGPAINILHTKVKSADDITVESDDSDIKTACFNSSSIEVLRDRYNLA